MNDNRAILEYERAKHRGRAPWWRTIILWEFICLTMWSMAFIGPILVLSGVASFVVPLDGLRLHGRPVDTTAERLHWLVVALTCTGCGLAFVAWHRRDMRRARQSTLLCPACKQYVTPREGECPECRAPMSKPPVTTAGEDGRLHDNGKKPLLLVLLALSVLVISAVIPPLWERSQLGWGQRFQTTICVVDAGNQTPLNVSFGGPSDRFDASYVVGPGFFTVSWKYRGNPFPIEVSSNGYEEVKLELRPDSPTQINVPLRRLDKIAPTDR